MHYLKLTLIIHALSEIKNLSEKVEINNKTITGFNLLNKETIKVLQIISNGKYIINGFTNKSNMEKYLMIIILII